MSTVRIFIQLKPFKERTGTADQIINRLPEAGGQNW